MPHFCYKPNLTSAKTLQILQLLQHELMQHLDLWSLGLGRTAACCLHRCNVRQCAGMSQQLHILRTLNLNTRALLDLSARLCPHVREVLTKTPRICRLNFQDCSRLL